MESDEVVELHLVSLCDINDIKRGAFDLQAMVGANYWVKHIEVDLTMSYVTRYHKSRNKLRYIGARFVALVLLFAEQMHLKFVHHLHQICCFVTTTLKTK